MNNFDSCQRAWDNRLPPDDSEEALAREAWEEDLDLRDVLSVQEMQEIIWNHFRDEPWLHERLDKAWQKHLQALKDVAEYDREAA